MTSSSSSTAPFSASTSSSTPEWQLYYWPKLPGRGEFARLLFHETSTPYTEPFARSSFQTIQTQRDQLSTIHPFFALPLLQHTPPTTASQSPSHPTHPTQQPSVYVTQSAVQCRYLSQHLDGGRLAAKTPLDDLRAQELLASAVDAIGEGCTAWHAIDTTASYDSQKEETQPFITAFITKRLPKWLEFFESALQGNGGKWFIGNEMTYVDIFIFQWLHGVESQQECNEVYKNAAIDGLRELKERVEKRPGTAERVRSRGPYDGTGPCF